MLATLIVKLRCLYLKDIKNIRDHPLMTSHFFEQFMIPLPHDTVVTKSLKTPPLWPLRHLWTIPDQICDYLIYTTSVSHSIKTCAHTQIIKKPP